MVAVFVDSGETIGIAQHKNCWRIPGVIYFVRNAKLKP